MSPIPQPDDTVDLVSTTERTIVDLRMIGVSPAVALGRYRYLSAHRPLSLQCHATLAVLVFATGPDVAFVIDGERRTVKSGEVLRITPGRVYGTGDQPERRGELFWLILDATSPAAPGSLAKICAELSAASSPDRIKAPSDTRARLGRIMTLATRNDPGWKSRALIEARLTTLLLELSGAETETKPVSEDNRHRIERVLKHMATHPEDVPDVSALARLAGLSPSSFFREFRAMTGTSPKSRLASEKIRFARRLLESPDAPAVTEVAHRLGFSSSQYFAAVFRRHEGVSPSSVRLDG